MLIKLLKYDLKYMIRNMLIFYTLSIFAAILTRIFFLLNQTTVVIVIRNICVGVMLSMIFSTIINTVIRSWIRFKSSLYGDESYLYHTLPVTKEQLIQAKFLESILFTLVGFGCAIISLLIAYASKENFELLKTSLLNLSGTLEINIYLFLALIVVLFFLEILNAISAGFVGIIIGHKKSERRILFSFIFGLVYYMLTQTITVLSVLFIGIFDSNIMSIFTSNEAINSKTLLLLCILNCIIYLLIIGASNFVSIKLLKRKLNVE